MIKTIIHDKQILFLALVVAFFVGASITGVFFDYDAEAKKDDNNGNNGCENGNPNAKTCENNPNTIPNTPPTIESVSIFWSNENSEVTGQEIAPIGTLTCIANDVNDVDGDLVSFTYSWFLEGNLVDTGNTHLIPIEEESGEMVCEITPFDETDFGVSVTAFVTILDCPPSCPGGSGV